jgi:hypothetical protein
VFEERELVPERDVAGALEERLAGRKGPKSANKVVDVKLAYWADEFKGGPDLLVPYYFIDVEFEDPAGREAGIEEGPKQVFRVPAYR